MAFRLDPGDLSNIRVLIVEDEYYLAADLAEALRARGAEVIGPENSPEGAIRAIESNGLDWAVLDMNLRGAMSYAVADRLDEAGVPYVIATGYSGESLPERFHGKPLVEKPYRPERVLELFTA